MPEVHMELLLKDAITDPICHRDDEIILLL
jgi:hypothetical protein